MNKFLSILIGLMFAGFANLATASERVCWHDTANNTVCCIHPWGGVYCVGQPTIPEVPPLPTVPPVTVIPGE